MIPRLTKGQRVTAWLGLKICKLLGYSLEDALEAGVKPETVQLMRDYRFLRELEGRGC